VFRSVARLDLRVGGALVLLALSASLSSCGSGDGGGNIASDSQPTVELPGADAPIEFDDLTYAPDLDWLLVPARDSGLYAVEPDTAKAHRVPGIAAADSVDAGEGLLYVLDRDEGIIVSVDPNLGKLLATTRTSSASDYVRYVAAGDEVWVTEPSAQRIEVFAAGPGRGRLRSDGFIRIPDGPEALTIGPSGSTAYTQSFDGDLVAIDIGGREVADTWPSGCEQSHGFPAIGRADALALAGCAADGEVALLEIAAGGRVLDSFSTGGGESLQAYSPVTGHFYVRPDPGDTIATLTVTNDGLELVGDVEVPENGHCLAVDDRGSYWTCDEDAGRVLRFTDPAASATG
jgi:hypothetical protein